MLEEDEPGVKDQKQLNAKNKQTQSIIVIILYNHKEVSECPILNPLPRVKTKSEMHPSESLSSRHALPWMNTSNTLPIFACPIGPSNPVFVWHFIEGVS
jgi:hypothetical protein